MVRRLRKILITFVWMLLTKLKQIDEILNVCKNMPADWEMITYIGIICPKIYCYELARTLNYILN